MSGVEVIGTVASLAQLGLFSISALDLYQQMRDAPAKIQRHRDTIEQLVRIVHLIRFSQWLQTENIIRTVQAILERVREIRRLFPQSQVSGSAGYVSFKDLRHVLLSVRREKQISSSFKALSESKSDLTLCILATQAQQTGDASSGIKILLDAVPKIEVLYEEFITSSAGSDMSKVSAVLLANRLLTSDSQAHTFQPASSSSPAENEPGRRQRQSNRLAGSEGSDPKLGNDILGSTYHSMHASGQSR
ncbi:hypothetical protein MMC20_006796 [Loxospora ochrophaea]|nr:hypothetical protein [Loxospora ochrophaea]